MLGPELDDNWFVGFTDCKNVGNVDSDASGWKVGRVDDDAAGWKVRCVDGDAEGWKVDHTDGDTEDWKVGRVGGDTIDIAGLVCGSIWTFIQFSFVSREGENSQPVKSIICTFRVPGHRISSLEGLSVWPKPNVILVPFVLCLSVPWR